jgi:hypothetical protein
MMPFLAKLSPSKIFEQVLYDKRQQQTTLLLLLIQITQTVKTMVDF